MNESIRVNADYSWGRHGLLEIMGKVADYLGLWKMHGLIEIMGKVADKSKWELRLEFIKWEMAAMFWGVTAYGGKKMGECEE